MTEDEAKKTDCPMQFANVHYGANIRCRGSDCMAWRWVQVMTNAIEMKMYRQSYMGGHQPEPIYADSEHGYCGLAGRP